MKCVSSPRETTSCAPMATNLVTAPEPDITIMYKYIFKT
jgi:hypothetical protein